MERILTKEEYTLLTNKPYLCFDTIKNGFTILNNLQVIYGDNVDQEKSIDRDHPLSDGLTAVFIGE